MIVEPIALASADLADAGLLLQGSIAVAELDETTRDALTEVGADLRWPTSLVFFGQAGRRLWDTHVQHALDRDDPFDEVARELVEAWFVERGARVETIYPGPALIPLGTLAAALRWGQPSPLGLTINPTFGLWMAHRWVGLTDAVVTMGPEGAESVHPCSSCETQDCVSACPVGAVSMMDGFDVATCARHRIEDDSACALQCLSRNACPVGAEHRYGESQMAHHYGSGLRSIRAWLDPQGRSGS